MFSFVRFNDLLFLFIISDVFSFFRLNTLTLAQVWFSGNCSIPGKCSVAYRFLVAKDLTADLSHSMASQCTNLSKAKGLMKQLIELVGVTEFGLSKMSSLERAKLFDAAFPKLTQLVYAKKDGLALNPAELAKTVSSQISYVRLYDRLCNARKSSVAQTSSISSPVSSLS